VEPNIEVLPVAVELQPSRTLLIFEAPSPFCDCSEENRASEMPPLVDGGIDVVGAEATGSAAALGFVEETAFGFSGIARDGFADDASLAVDSAPTLVG